MPRELINRNEVLQGPSPRVLETIRRFDSGHLNRYLDGYSPSILIPKLSDLFSLPKEQIILSYGIEDFLRTLFDRLDSETDSVLTHRLHYSYYKRYLEFRAVALHTFEMKVAGDAFVFDLDDCIERCKRLRPAVVLLTSPNNPTANRLSAADLGRILGAADSEILVVVDEAYRGFDSDYDEAQFVALVRRHPNLALLRSFSKWYALAGLRVGFALCGRRVKQMLRYQDRYLGISRLSEEVAIAALESTDYYEQLAGEIVADRERFIAELNTVTNFTAYRSYANFVAVKVAEPLVAPVAAALDRHDDAVIAKFVDRDLMRVTIGSRKHSETFLQLLRSIERQPAEVCKSEV